MPIVKVVHREVAEEPATPLIFGHLGFLEIFRFVGDNVGCKVRIKTDGSHYGFFPSTLGSVCFEANTGNVKMDSPVVRLDATLSDVHEAKEQ